MNTDFHRLWAAQAVSAFGARITREGLPIMAVIAYRVDSTSVHGMCQCLRPEHPGRD